MNDEDDDVDDDDKEDDNEARKSIELVEEMNLKKQFFAESPRL